MSREEELLALAMDDEEEVDESEGDDDEEEVDELDTDEDEEE